MEKIVTQTINILGTSCKDGCISPYPEDEEVRMCIHAILRCFILQYSDYGCLAPMAGLINCKHGENCAHVIGYSMFLWAFSKFSKIHENQEKSSGCSFAHENWKALRSQVFSFLNKEYSSTPYNTSPAFMAVENVNAFYENVVKDNEDFKKTKIYCFNFSSKKFFDAMCEKRNIENIRTRLEFIIKPDDSIFDYGKA